MDELTSLRRFRDTIQSCVIHFRFTMQLVAVFLFLSVPSSACDPIKCCETTKNGSLLRAMEFVRQCDTF